MCIRDRVLLFFMGRAVGIARSRRRLPDHPAQMEPPQSPAEPESVPETPESVPEPVPEPEVPAASEETPVPPVIVPESAPAEEAPAPEAVTPPEEMCIRDRATGRGRIDMGISSSSQSSASQHSRWISNSMVREALE